MKNNWSSHTTEKLFFAELQLKQWQVSSDRADANTLNLQESTKQSAILLISLGWESFINELSEYHQHAQRVIATLEQLELLLGADTPEIAYLTSISKEPGSWLNDLNRLSRGLRYPSVKGPTAPDSTSSGSLIIAVSEKDSDIDSLENISNILSDCKNYIKDCRSRMSEW